jgi:hypothetical protein
MEISNQVQTRAGQAMGTFHSSTEGILKEAKHMVSCKEMDQEKHKRSR